MRNTKQDGDEDTFESTEVSAKFRRSVKEHLPRSTSRRSEQEVTNNTKHAQRATHELSRVAEVTKIGTSKRSSTSREAIRRSHSRKFSREVLQRTSRDNQ